jgi:hypothetical protein
MPLGGLFGGMLNIAAILCGCTVLLSVNLYLLPIGWRS